MKKYARVINGSVVEIMSFDDDMVIADMFHPDIASTIFECGDDVRESWGFADGAFSQPTVPVTSLADLQSAKIGEVISKSEEILAAGAPVTGGLHIALDDCSRTDMSEMTTTALASSAAAMPWPDSYKQGWISIENTRIPLPTATDGLTLATGVADYYAKVRQNGRSLKDAVVAAKKQSDLDAVDITSGWPS